MSLDASRSVDPDGSIVAYGWDFDSDSTIDQTTAGPTVNHVYTTPGSWQPQVTVTDDDGATDTFATAPIEVAAGVPDHVPPTATIGATSTVGTVGQPIAFDASASAAAPGSTITGYGWDYEGDGMIDETTAGPSSVHAYGALGVFRATVTVTDETGTFTTASVPVKVLPDAAAPPVAAFTQSHTQGTSPLTVGFDASTSTAAAPATITAYGWDFDGNGTIDETTTSPTAVHTYDPGIYHPRLVITDSNGTESVTATLGERIDADPAPGTVDEVQVTITGGINYTNSGTLTGGGITVARNANGTINRVTGTANLPSMSGTGTATVRFNVRQFLVFLPLYLGDVTVSDPAGGLSSLTSMIFFGSVTPVGSDGARASHSWFTILPPLRFVSYNITWTTHDRD